MKRFAVILLIIALIAGAAMAEGAENVSSFVERQGYKPASVRNKAGLVGCWFVEGKDEDTLQWSDRTRLYTLSDAPGALRYLYAEMIDMCEWDTCTYTADDKVQFAYNAPEITSVKSYKTLKNYVKYVGEYLEKLTPTVKPRKNSAKQTTYVINKTSKKFHLPDCASAKKIKKGNMEKYTGSRSDLIARGYSPCKNCKP